MEMPIGPVTPGAVLPARELLGDLLLELGKPREEAAEYEACALGSLCARGDRSRPEKASMRTYLAGKD